MWGNSSAVAQLAKPLVPFAHDAARTVARCVIRFVVTGHKFAHAIAEPSAVYPANDAARAVSNVCVFHRVFHLMPDDARRRRAGCGLFVLSFENVADGGRIPLFAVTGRNPPAV